MNEKPAAADFLLERLVDGHCRFGIDTFIIDVRYDANDAARFRADIDELHDWIRPLQMAIDGIPTWKQFIGRTAADDHDALSSDAIRLVEITAGEDWNSQCCKEAGGYGAEACTRIVLRIFSRVFRCRKS